MSIPFWVIFGLILILPFFPIQINPYINYLIWGGGLILIPFLIKFIKEGIAKREITIFLWIVFLLSLAISTLFSVDQKISFSSFLTFFSSFILFISANRFLNSPKSQEKLAILITVSASILSLVSLYQTFFLGYINKARLGVSFMWVYFGHNHLSSLLIFAIPLVIFLLKNHWNNLRLRIILILDTWFLIVSLFFTFSKSSMVSLVLGSFIVVASLRLLKKRELILIFLLGFLFLLFIITTLPGSGKFFGITKALWEFSGRDIYWQIALNNFSNHPLIGTGLDTTRFAELYNNNSSTISSDYAHNFFFQLLSDAGILGFFSGAILIGWIIYKTLKNSFRKISQFQESLYLSCSIALTASFLNSLTDFDWQLPTVFIIFCVIAGITTQEKSGD